MYTLAGHVSQHLAGGTQWEELIDELIFTPLGMADSTFTYRALPDLEDHATPYLRVDGDLVVAPWQMFM